tara:strand:- start:344 stop:757 length:414 start_codon:yes stop_codon:yes gene_type:complete
MTFRPDFPETKYRAEVVRVIDGDTFEVEVDLGFRVMRSMRIRLLGVDTPELRRGSAESKKKGAEARAWVEDLILHRWVLIDSTTTKSFDRWVAAVYFYVRDPVSLHEKEGQPIWYDLADALVTAGHAKPTYRPRPQR